MKELRADASDTHTLEEGRLFEQEAVLVRLNHETAQSGRLLRGERPLLPGDGVHPRQSSRSVWSTPRADAGGQVLDWAVQV